MSETAIQNTAAKPKAWIHRQMVLELSLSVIFALIAAGLIALYYPFKLTFEMDLDEGLNLMKAALLYHGYPLYAQIWSDQPPLFTYILAAVMSVSEFNVNVARVAVLGLSTAAMWGVYGFLRLTWSRLAGVLGLVLLVLSPYYARLSLSVMVGLPALTFAVLSLAALALWHLKQKKLWLALSAALLGLSVLTKIFTGFLAPIFVAGLLVDAYARREQEASWRDWVQPALIWGVTFSGVVGVLGVALVGPANLDQLITPHLEARSIDLYQGFYPLEAVLVEAYPLLALAALGAVLALLKRRWLALYPLAWIAAVIVLLSNHSPVWYHHLLLITIPAAILGAAGVQESVTALTGLFNAEKRRILPAVLGLLSIAGLVWFYSATVTVTLEEFETTPLTARLDERVSWVGEAKFLDEISEYAGQHPDEWIVTDLPMYAFRTGLLVPPELAVISTKRLETGNLSEEEIVRVIRDYQPGLIYLGRNRYPKVYDYIEAQDQYSLVEMRQKRRLYQRAAGS